MSVPALTEIYTPFFTPMKSIVEKITRAFESGSIVRVKGFPIRIYCLRDPDHIAQLFNSPEAGGKKYPGMMPRVKRVMGSGAYILAGADDWKERRLKVQALFKRSHLVKDMEVVPPLVNDLLADWDRFAKSGETFDVFKPLQLLITRINLRLFFSVDIQGEELRRIQEETHFVDLHFVKPSPLWIPFPKNLRFKRCVQNLRRRMLGWIAARRLTESKDDLLSHLLNLTHSKTGAPWTNDDIVGEVFSVYFGASVMGTSLGWMFYLIASHPDVQKKIAQEMRDVKDGRTPNAEDLLKLKYAQGVVKEALRIFPPSWGYPRFTHDGMSIDGLAIPPKSLVIPMVYITQRDERLWKDAKSYKPERFILEENQTIHPYAYFPFGSGPRACLGAGLAPMVMQTIVDMVFIKFQMEFMPRFSGDPVADFGFEIHPRDQVCVRISGVSSDPTHRRAAGES